MKSTGVVRKVDGLGRIVIPIELRRNLKIAVEDPLEIFVDGDQILLQKYKSQMECAITGEVSNENQTFGNGSIILSQEGAEQLKKEIEEAIKK